MSFFRMMLVVLAVQVLAAAAQAGELDKPYTPTRKEWLEVTVFQLVVNEFDSSQYRIDTDVVVNEAAQAVEVTVRCANGEKSACKFSLRAQLDSVKLHVENFLKKYDWAAPFKVVTKDTAE